MARLKHPTRWVVAATVVIASALRVQTALAAFRTADELTWLARSQLFAEALADGRFGDASSGGIVPGVVPEGATMPGVTTMWIGTAADVLWSWGERLGLVDAEQVTVAADGVYPTLELGQVLMAVVCGVLVGLIALLVARWCGIRAGAVAGLLVATEPFVVAHGAVLHTDELVALCGVGGLLAWALVLGVPRPTPWAGRTSTAVLAGALLAGAVLTKLTALAFLPGLALLVGWAFVAAGRAGGDDEGVEGPVVAGDRDGRGGAAAAGGAGGRPAAGDPTTPVTADAVTVVAAPADDVAVVDQGADRSARPGRRHLGRLVAVGAAVAVAVVVVTYPALWADPVGEVRAIRGSLGLGSSGHLQFFRGQITDDPGPAFYPVAIAFRLTPWLFVGSLVAGVAIWLPRRTRGYAAVLACIGAPVMLALTVASKKLDRYGLVLVVLAALVVAVVVDDVVARSRRHGWARGAPARAAVGAGVVGCLALVAWSAALAPWGLAYFNPALGGSAGAERTVLVGWGEGMFQALELIDEREGGDCEDVTVAGPMLSFNVLPCGEVGTGPSTDYVLIYVNDRQRHPPSWVDVQTEGRELVGVVEERGIRYVEVWR
jgi:hypothetical protein